MEKNFCLVRYVISNSINNEFILLGLVKVKKMLSSWCLASGIILDAIGNFNQDIKIMKLKKIVFTIRKIDYLYVGF